MTKLPPPILRNNCAGTVFHAKFYAYALTRKHENDFEQIQQPLLSAKVDLNPHQVQAALFALNTSREKGVLLADEVGLGKTIECGLVLCQQIDRTADDKIAVAEDKIRRCRDKKLEIAQKIRAAQTLDEQDVLAEEKKKAERELSRARRERDDVEDDVDAQREKLHEALRRKLSTKTNSEILFTICWRVV